MNCESCPFKDQVKVLGEGTRFHMELKKVPRLEGARKVYIEKELPVYERDGQYDVVCVGMAPAREEVYQGRPFVGVSGQTLRQTLRNLGIEHFYLTNVFLCPITDDTLIPQALEACNCKQRLIEEILSKQPKLTIALGELPLHTLSDVEYTITEVEGRIIPSSVGSLLPLVHPAYYWRHPQDFFDFIEGARSGIRWLSGTYTQCSEPEFEVADSDNWQEIKRNIDKYEEVGVDLETTGFAAYGWEPDRILEMGLAVSPDKAYIVDAEMIPEFKEILEKKKGIYWNAQFDAAFLRQIGIRANIEYDGMLAHYSLDERPYSHGLKRVARTYLGADNWEKELDQYIPKRMKKSVSYEVVPKEIRNQYLAKDVTRTLQLKHAMQDYVDMKLMDRMLMPACRMFVDIEERGMRVDPVKLMRFDDILEEDLGKLETEIHDLAGYWLNPMSYPEVSELLYGRMGLPVDPKLGETTNKAALEQYRDIELVDKIIQYRATNKMKGTYIEGFAKFVDKQYRIHPTIKIYGSETGRLSSERPSIMNIKTDTGLKEIFLADVNEYLIYGDIKGNELRWYGIIGEDTEIQQMFRDGRDPHTEVGIIAYGSKEKSLDNRMIVKAGVFGQVYGRSRDSMERSFGSENVDAVMEAIRKVVPNIGNYYKVTQKQLKEKGYLESYFHRKRRFPLVTPETKNHVLREAVNFPIQSSGSDLMLLNMLHLWELKDKWEIWPFWPVHDSITMNATSYKVIDEIKKELESYSLELVEGIIPFIWEMDWDTDWSMQRSKRK